MMNLSQMHTVSCLSACPGYPTRRPLVLVQRVFVLRRLSGVGEPRMIPWILATLI